MARAEELRLKENQRAVFLDEEAAKLLGIDAEGDEPHAIVTRLDKGEGRRPAPIKVELSEKSGVVAAALLKGVVDSESLARRGVRAVIPGSDVASAEWLIELGMQEVGASNRLGHVPDGARVFASSVGKLAGRLAELSPPSAN